MEKQWITNGNPEEDIEVYPLGWEMNPDWVDAILIDQLQAEIDAER